MAIFDKISGISTGSGFKYRSEAPLDARLVVDTFSELAELVDGNGAYAGMLVYVKNGTTTGTITYPKGYYFYDGVNWAEFKGTGTSNAEGADKVQVTLDDGSKPYATITISAEDPNGGNVGDIWFKY